MALVLKELKDQIGWITLNHDAKRNALSIGLLTELLLALKALKEEKARVIIIRANKGMKVWSSGFFIDELPRDGSDPLAYDNPLQKVIRAIQGTPVPVIAMAEGSIWGGACNIAFVCDMVVGTKDTCLFLTIRQASYNFWISLDLILLRKCFLLQSQFLPKKHIV
jgi:methylmalonyl-CoA decarboxylase